MRKQRKDIVFPTKAADDDCPSTPGRWGYRTKAEFKLEELAILQRKVEEWQRTHRGGPSGGSEVW